MAQDVRASGAEGGRQAMPAGVRRALFASLAIVLAGALYLIAVRGEALLTDLSGLTQRILLCF
ncbi:MAG TPA: hypothetical protein VG758_25585 [Hyphomicrobiaceae bacterium]|jgi:hypothetical protein|nr:hypothetical protein [Hyphomicrobiaceae bacterium]